MINVVTIPCIVVPSDQDSLEKLYRQEFREVNCTSLTFTRNELYGFWETGFFDFLNEKYNLFIADYETEEIVDNLILNSVLSIDLVEYRKQSLLYANYWNDLTSLFASAIENETGVFFMF